MQQYLPAEGESGYPPDKGDNSNTPLIRGDQGGFTMNPSNLPKSNPALTRSKSNGATAESVDVQAAGGKSGSIGNVVTQK